MSDYLVSGKIKNKRSLSKAAKCSVRDVKLVQFAASVHGKVFSRLTKKQLCNLRDMSRLYDFNVSAEIVHITNAGDLACHIVGLVRGRDSE